MSNHKLFQNSQPSVQNNYSLNSQARINPPSPLYTMPPQRRPFPTALFAIFAVIVGLALEQWAPPQFRPSIFTSTKSGNYDANKAKTSAPEIAKAQSLIKQKETVAVANVEYSNDCRKDIKKKANESSIQCFTEGKLTSSACDFIEKKALEKLENCPPMPS